MSMYALCISFRTDNLNCFRASSLWRSRWQRCPNPGRNVRNRPLPINDAFAMVLSPNHKHFGYFEVLMWFRDGAIRGGHWEV